MCPDIPEFDYWESPDGCVAAQSIRNNALEILQKHN